MKKIIFPFLMLLSYLFLGCNSKADATNNTFEVAEYSELDDMLIPSDSLEAYMPHLATYNDIIKEIKESDASLVVVNFWATWCVPCIEEFPVFKALGENHEADDIKVMFVSVDFEDEIEYAAEFLYEQEVTWKTFLATGDNNDFIMSFNPEWTGAVPATFLYDKEGNQLTFWEGKVTEDELNERISEYHTLTK